MLLFAAHDLKDSCTFIPQDEMTENIKYEIFSDHSIP